MNNQERFLKIIEIIKKKSIADDFIINYSCSENALTRVANNMVTQNINNQKEEIKLTSYIDNKKGSLSTMDLKEESVSNIVLKCEELTKKSVEDKEYIGTLSENKEISKDIVDEKILELGPEFRAEIAKRAIERANKINVKVFGSVKNSYSSNGVCTKNGVYDFCNFTNISYSNTVDIKNEKGSSYSNGFQIDSITPEANFEEAYNDAQLLQKRKDYKPGRYKVLISAKAAVKLFAWLGFYGSDRRAVDEGYSPFTGKLEKKIVDDKINIYTDPYFKKAPSKPFSEEGLRIKKNYFIKNGIVENIPCDRYWAKKNNYVPWNMSNIIIDDTEIEEKELLKKIDNGFYIKDFWYIRMVKMNDFILTGMTRNGFFKVENGEIINGATHFRWNDSPIRILNNIEGIGKGISEINSYFSVYSPSLIVDNFYLSSKTLF